MDEDFTRRLRAHIQVLDSLHWNLTSTMPLPDLGWATISIMFWVAYL